MNKKKIEDGVKLILDGIGENKNRNGLIDTPKRIANFYSEWLEYNKKINYTVFEENYDGMVIIKDIPIYSLCEHHMLPFIGTVHVGYIPSKKVIGLSKITKIVQKYARRLQIQERMGRQIADEINDALKPLGIMIVIETEHLCMSMRGVRTPGSTTITSEVRGAFEKEQKTREEFLLLTRKK